MYDDKKIKVLQQTYLGIGGITSMVLNIQEHIDRDKVSFDYLVFRDQKEPEEERALKFGGRKIIANSATGKNAGTRFLIKLFKTYTTLKQEQFDVLHINASNPFDTLVGVVAKIAGVKRIIVHSHNANSAKNKGIKKLINSVCKAIMPLFIDAYFTCSTEAAAYLFPKKIFANKQYTYIKNGIDVNKFSFNEKTRAKARNRYGLNNAFVIGNIGRLSKQKNQKFLLDIVKELVNVKPETILILIGVGELEHELKAKAKALGIENNVIFWGASQNINELMMIMDVFVMTSFHEGLPVVGIEAQASGLSCVFADTITKEVKISDNVEFVPLAKSAEEWAKIVLEIAEKENNRILGVKAAENAGFTIDAVAKDLEERYIEICKDK